MHACRASKKVIPQFALGRRTSIDGFMERSTLGAKASPLMRKRLRSTSKRSRKTFFVAQAVDREVPSGAKLVGCIMLCGTPDPEVGRRLIEALLEKARAANYRKLVFLTAAPLEAALRQYERFGFRISARSENHDWRVDGGAVVKIKMGEVSKGLVQDAAAEAPRRRSFEPQALSGSNRAVVQIADPLPS